MQAQMRRHQARWQGASRRTSMAVKCADIAKDGSPMERVAPGKTRLGFAGIGIMGLAMARNLLAAGYAVNVWNRNASKCSELVEAGAQLSSSPAELARQSDVTFAMLSDPPAALAVACGPQGVAAGLAPGKGYVDVSTVDAATSAAIAQAVRSAGALFLEAPVSGSKKPAEDGKLIFLAAGDKVLFDAATPALDVMGKASFYLGEVGAGANMKLVVNMIMGSTMVAFAEGLALAGKAGLKQADVLEVLGLGAVAAPMFAMKGPAMIQSDSSFPPAFPLKHQQKDMRLAITLGDELAQPLPLAAAANSVYVQARGQGLGELDFSAVIRAVLAQQQAGNA